MTTTLDLRKVFGVMMTYNANQKQAEPFEMEATFEPGAKSGIHIHPEQDEHYKVTGGEMEVYLNGSWHKLVIGGEVHIPKGAEHAFRNLGDKPAMAINVHNPGLRTQDYFETMDRLIKNGKITGMTGLRNGIYLSLHSVKFADVVILRQPPDAFIRLTALIGRLCGYKI
ncbi:MAG: cupin domain-containing protein [Saprospiraceae bacterium]|nr:cupin domain-containing protein [Saprospiraceae bacterium]